MGIFTFGRPKVAAPDGPLPMDSLRMWGGLVAAAFDSFEPPESIKQTLELEIFPMLGGETLPSARALAAFRDFIDSQRRVADTLRGATPPPYFVTAHSMLIPAVEAAFAEMQALHTQLDAGLRWVSSRYKDRESSKEMQQAERDLPRRVLERRLRVTEFAKAFVAVRKNHPQAVEALALDEVLLASILGAYPTKERARDSADE